MANENHFQQFGSDNNTFKIKLVSFGSIFHGVLDVSKSCWMMQLPACPVQASGQMSLLEWTTTKLVILHQEFLVRWLATNLVLIRQICDWTISCLSLIILDGHATSFLLPMTLTSPDLILNIHKYILHLLVHSHIKNPTIRITSEYSSLKVNLIVFRLYIYILI